MPHARALRLSILEGDLALRACALRLGMSGAADQFDVPDGSVSAEMACDRKVVHSANGGLIFHFLR